MKRLPPFEGFPKLGVPFWGSQYKDYSLLGAILGSPHFGKLPFFENTLLSMEPGGHWEERPVLQAGASNPTAVVSAQLARKMNSNVTFFRNIGKYATVGSTTMKKMTMVQIVAGSQSSTHHNSSGRLEKFNCGVRT